MATYNRGETYLKLGRLNDALADFDTTIETVLAGGRSVELDSATFGLAYLDRGAVRAQQGAVQLALRDYDRAVELLPHFAKAYLNRGEAYHQLGRVQEALRDYGKAIAPQPDSAEAFNNRAEAYRVLKQPANALANVKRAIELRPTTRKPSITAA